MPFMGSSRITTITITVTGGVGPTGETGPAGNTGNYITGPRGNIGFGITGLTYDSVSDGLTFYIQGTTAVFLTGFKGNTGAAETLPPPTIASIGQGISFVDSSGYTLFFRSITFSSGISASVSGQSVVIQENIGDTGSFDPNKLLFVGFGNGIYYLDSSDFVNYKETVYSGTTYGNLEVTRRTNRDLFGVENFNYSTGSGQNIAHYGLTMTIDSAFYGITGTENDLHSDVWNPYLKYRVNYPDYRGLCGPTFGAIQFSPLGPYTKQVKFAVEFGSCCYCDGCQNTENEISGRMCKDYVLKEYCEQINGRWSRLNCYQRTDSFDCYRKRACCLNGRCINTSLEKCSEMHGIFCALYECNNGYTCGGLCQPPSLELVNPACCCCKDGIATSVNCDTPAITSCTQSGGKHFTYSCSSSGLNCCDHIIGACCINGSCSSKSAFECSAQNGIFYGQGSTCSNVNCCHPV